MTFLSIIGTIGSGGVTRGGDHKCQGRVCHSPNQTYWLSSVIFFRTLKVPSHTLKTEREPSERDPLRPTVQYRCKFLGIPLRRRFRSLTPEVGSRYILSLEGGSRWTPSKLPLGGWSQSGSLLMSTSVVESLLEDSLGPGLSGSIRR